ncbi:hypothetical protein G6F65_016297 [Rhizopus arrhizus]|nr:hypothetical protein G6F65_016297 [Rhizopus arrhizus]
MELAFRASPILRAQCFRRHPQAVETGGHGRFVAQGFGNTGRGIDQGFDPVVLQAFGRGRNRQSRHQLDGVVENAGGDAPHAKLQLFVIARITMAAHQGQLALQAVQVGQAVARVAGQAACR